ncbi:MAG TPA: DUF2269 domain-containing protein [Bacillota bacterium]|nr:DUF2269 domain-containing protein [Bacillota bacterium]
MKKLGSTGMKWLKIIHLIGIIIWIGGAICMMVLAFGVPLTTFNEVKNAYAAMKIIDDIMVRNGALITMITSLTYGFWTNWGFFKLRWITAKWGIFIGQLIFAIFFLNRWLEANLVILENEPAGVLNNPAFLRNHVSNQIGMGVMIAAFILVIGISVLKPWKKKSGVAPN